jgi:type II secretory pathway pseudopilin PulG
MERRPAGTTACRHSGRPAITLVELLVVVVCIALLAAALLGAYGAVRVEADKTLCAARLKGIGTAFLGYAKGNGGLLPDAGAASSLAGPIPDDGWHFPDRWDGRGTAFWPRERRTGNAGNLYLLVRLGLAEPRDFVCPASGDEPAFGPFFEQRFSFLAFKRGSLSLTTREKEFLRLKATRHCSYSYQNMLGHRQGDPAVADPEAGSLHIDYAPPDLAIVADHNPYTQMRGENRPRVDPEAEPLANSLNHAGQGQNVLTVDGRVAWHATPLCGAVLGDGTRDHIYRPAAGAVRDPANIPRHVRDSYLVP